MGFFNSLFGESEKTNSADIAKGRLQVMIATHHQLNARLPPERIDEMKREILVVVNKFIHGVRMDDVKIHQRQEDNLDILEMNVNLPDRDA